MSTLDRLESLAKPWSALWRRCPTATPFQSPQWLLPWWREFGGAELCAFAVWDDERLCALAPLFCYSDHEQRRRLALLGTGITDLQDALIEPGLEQSVMALFYQWLGSEAPAWHECVFEQLPAASPLLECGLRNAECGGEETGVRRGQGDLGTGRLGDWRMRNAECGMEKCGWNVEIAPQDTCLLLSLPGQSGDFAQAIPAAMLKNVRYYERRAREAGDLRFERATPANFDEHFEALLHLHGARWGERGQAGVLAGAAIARFHREAASTLLAAGMLRLYALRLDGRIIACHYGFFHGASAYYYLGGFDPEAKGLSPGTLLVAHAIAEAAREGARVFNFLRGREPYKYRWGACDRPCYRLQLRK